jgi:aspartate aminotransferase
MYRGGPMAVADKIVGMMERSSWIRKMFENGAKLKQQYGPEKVFDFSIGNPNVPPPKAFFDALEETITLEEPNKHGYMPNAGYPVVRKEVADYVSGEQGVELGPEHVIMTAGAGGAVNVALKTIMNPGDTVITSAPFFVEYQFYADNHGGSLKLVPSKEDFDLDVAALENAIDETTCALIINSPNNPTGRVYPEGTIRDLAAMLEEKSREIGRTVYIVSDEPYRKIVYDGVKVPSILKNYKHTMVSASYSKELSIPGERIGWLIIGPEADDAENLAAGAVLCNRIIGFVNAPALMQRVVGKLQGSQVDVEIYKRKRDALYEGLTQIGYELYKPEGTFYLFPKAPGGDDIRAVEALTRELVLTVPGKGFGCPGYFRISYCVEDRVIEGSMEGFERAFKKLQE